VQCELAERYGRAAPGCVVREVSMKTNTEQVSLTFESTPGSGTSLTLVACSLAVLSLGLALAGALGRMIETSWTIL
jgi:hypothetical protein